MLLVRLASLLILQAIIHPAHLQCVQEAGMLPATWRACLIALLRCGGCRWTRQWTAEENRHGDLMNKYCYLSGRVNMKVPSLPSSALPSLQPLLAGSRSLHVGQAACVAPVLPAWA
jgi:hypothetical protein